MMKKILLAVVLCGSFGLTSVSAQQAEERLPGYLQAEKFTKSKLDKMLFSTTVDPHWFQQGNNFWFEYKIGEGKFWYVVNPSAKRKELLFDRERMASQLTEIIQDPFEARQLPIADLKVGEDGRTFTFKVVSKADSTFYFSYDYPSRKLTHLKDKKKELDKPDWASVSPDGQRVIYAKDCDLYYMSIADYQKARKDEKDSTIVEVRLTTDGTPDFGYGIPYSTLNTDTLCNGKRREVWG